MRGLSRRPLARVVRRRMSPEMALRRTARNHVCRLRCSRYCLAHALTAAHDPMRLYPD